MSDKVFDNSNNGMLFDAANMSVYRQGKCKVDNVEREFLITQTHNNKTGETYFDLFEKVGTVKPNRNKKSEKSPDMIGDFQAYPRNDETGFDGRYMIFGNKRISNNTGNEFTAVSVRPKEDRPQTQKVPMVAHTPDLDGAEAHQFEPNKPKDNPF